MSQSSMATAIDNSSVQSQGCVLVVSDSSETTTIVENNLLQQGFDILLASEGKSALNLFAAKHIDFVFIEADHIDVPIDELVYKLRVRAGNVFIPVIILVSAEDEKLLSECVSAGCDDFIFKPFTATALKARFSTLQQVCELKKSYKSSITEQLVAKQILAYALSERNVQFEEIQLLSTSKAVFSGDLFLTAKRPDGGLHVLLADFTGHGLSAAIGALPVADIFSVMTNKGFELEDVLENINNKLHTLLPVSMFMACSMLKIHNDQKHASVWNGGMPDIYLRDSQTGDIKNKIKASHIPLGIDEATSNNFKLQTIDICPEDQFIIYTDGLTEAENASGDMFGYQNLDQCLENNRKKEFVFASIVAAFNRFCGDVSPGDDVSLACIPCADKMTEVNDSDFVNSLQIASNRDDGWSWYMELSGANLHNVNPIPIVMSEVRKISGYSVCNNKLSNILTVLYENAIEHGLLTASLADFAKNDAKNNSNDNNKKTNKENDDYIRIGLRKVEHQGEPALLVSIEDSGNGFDHKEFMDELINRSGGKDTGNNGIPLVYELTESLYYHGRGNRVEAIISQRL